MTPIPFIDLEPRWVGYGGEGVTMNGQPVPERFKIGVSFKCPCGCHHRCYIPFENPIDGGPPIEPGKPNWTRTGETFETMTLHPSIRRIYPDCWHGHITNGMVTFCNDSKTHKPVPKDSV